MHPRIPAAAFITTLVIEGADRSGRELTEGHPERVPNMSNVTPTRTRLLHSQVSIHPDFDGILYLTVDETLWIELVGIFAPDIFQAENFDTMSGTHTFTRKEPLTYRL